MVDVLNPVVAPAPTPHAAEASAADVRRTVLSIAWKTWLRSFRNNTSKMVMTSIFTVLALPYVGSAAAGAVMLSTLSPATAHTIIVLGAAVVSVAWWVFALLFVGSSQAVDPRRFALFPVPGKHLLVPLFLAALISIPMVFTVLVGLATLFAWSRFPVALLGAVVGVSLGLVLMVGTMQAIVTAASARMSSRRAKENSQIILFIGMMMFGVAFYGVTSLIATFRSSLTEENFRRLADWVSYVPWAAPWAIGGDLALGQYPQAVAHLVIALASLAGVAWWWSRSINASLSSTVVSGTGGADKVKRAGFRLPARLGAGPAGAVRWRALLSYARDPRQRMSLISLILFPLFLFAPALMMKDSGLMTFQASFGLGMLAYFMPAVLANHYGYDGSALWHHAVSGIRGRDEVWGRVSAVMIVLVPLSLVLAVICLSVIQASPFTYLLALSGMVALGGCGFGVYAWRMARFPYPLPPPGSNIFASQNQGDAFLGSLVSMLLQVACAAPSIILCIVSFFVPLLTPVAVIVAIVSAVVAIRMGVRAGGDDLERRWPEVFARVSVKID